MKATRPKPWSNREVELVVRDYIEMLKKELLGIKYSKAVHRRALMPLLDNRSEGSVEMKHMNISGVMADLGRSFIKGYKPASNYQKSLAVTVKSELGIKDEEEVKESSNLHEGCECAVCGFIIESEDGGESSQHGSIHVACSFGL